MFTSIIALTIVIRTIAIIITTSVAMTAAMPAATTTVSVDIRIMMKASANIIHIITLKVFILCVVLLIHSL